MTGWWRFLLVWAVACCAAAGHALREPLDLAGDWSVRLDPFDQGTKSSWETSRLPDPINLPGTVQDEDTDYGFLSQDEAPIVPHRHYRGVAWFSRRFSVSPEHAGKPMMLQMGYTSSAVRCWIDGRLAGQSPAAQAGLQMPIPPLTEGSHRIHLRLDNSAAPDWWLGVLGHIRLVALQPHYIHTAQFFTQPGRDALTIRCQLQIARPGRLHVRLATQPETQVSVPVVPAANGLTSVTVVAPLPPDTPVWSDEAPKLIDCVMGLVVDGWQTDRLVYQVGVRDMAVAGRSATWNGAPLFLRMGYAPAVWPAEGTPPTHIDGWLSIMRHARQLGLNGLRFESWMPPKVAFEAADREGMLIHADITIAPGTELEQAQLIVSRILEQNGSHPSLAFITVNAPKAIASPLRTWIATVTQRQLVVAASGEDGAITLTAQPDPEHNRPQILAPVSRYAIYSDLSELAAFQSVMEPRALQLRRQRLSASGLIGQAGRFSRASGNWAFLRLASRMDQIVADTDIIGYQTDAFWDGPDPMTATGAYTVAGAPRPHVSVEQYADVLSAAGWRLLQPDRVFIGGRLLELTWVRRDARSAPDRLAWELTDGQGATLARGELSAFSERQARMTVPLPAVDHPVMATLRLTGQARTVTLWIFPEPRGDRPSTVGLYTAWDEVLAAKLAAGETAILQPTHVPHTEPVDPAYYGLLCEPDHPALAGFPTAEQADVNWQPLLPLLTPIPLDRAPLALRPTVQVIDPGLHPVRRGVIFQARVGMGRLLVVAVRPPADPNPQYERLMASLVQYVQSPAFRPSVELAPDWLGQFRAPAAESDPALVESVND